MVATQAKVVRNGKTGSAKLSAKEAIMTAIDTLVTAESKAKAPAKTTRKAAPAKAAALPTGTKTASPQAKARTAPAKAKTAPAKAEPQATPYWQYSRETLESLYAALSEIDPEALAVIAEARDTVGTKATMALVIAAANGDEPNFERLMKGRE